MSCHGAEKVEMLIVFCMKQLILSNLFYSFSEQNKPISGVGVGNSGEFLQA